jgi:polygalacturonase
MNRCAIFPSLCLLTLFVAANLCGGASVGSNTELAIGRTAHHVVGIDAGTLTVAAGSTQSFTVDTPEDKGVISTTPDVARLFAEITAKDASVQTYRIVGKDGAAKTSGAVEAGDQLVVTAADGQSSKNYIIALKPLAISGQLELEKNSVTANTTQDIKLRFTAGQRSPDATVKITVPTGISPTLDNTTVNVIGRGAVSLRELPKQSIGRVGSAYSYSKVGEVTIESAPDSGTTLIFSHLDLRPANGADLVIVFHGVTLARAGNYAFRAVYTTAKPEVLTSAGVGSEVATLTATTGISDFARVVEPTRRYRETATTYTVAKFTWNSADTRAPVQVMQSLDEGKTWARAVAQVDAAHSTAIVLGLEPNRLYTFRLDVASGPNQGMSNSARFYSGKLDIKTTGVTGDGQGDDTDKINEAIAHLAELGGGTLLFSDGTYNVRTVHLRSNVYLYVAAGATITAIKGADAPEAAWFSDRKYRSGLSPTDAGPYAEPENWLTKEDVGHHYFRNSMFFGERLDNVKIIGNGRITGGGILVTGDNVMRNPADDRADKMFTLKLCTNLEIGGVQRDDDMWYDEQKDEPCYLRQNGEKDGDISNMLQLDRAGHFVLLASGTDGIDVHDTYIGQHGTGSSRDIYDFMQCSDVVATNIYCKLTSDDIVKPGSDCSLGFTRPAKVYRVRNIVGDTNCNLFQIGSETADDIMDLQVDNIYVLGGNKAGFSISTNDGGHVKDVYLNSGRTGPLHSRSKIMRAHTPFFISISNRGRIIGATVARFKFDENGKAHDELLNTNINIGEVENIVLNGVDVSETYAGSSFRGGRWKAYDGSQPKQAPIVAGYALPDASVVQGGLTFKLPNGRHTGYIKNIVFNDVHVLAKGGNPAADISRKPPELGVGQYNASNLGVLPAYGFYARHVEGLSVTNCTFNYEKRDSTPALYFDDVIGAKLKGVKCVAADDQEIIAKVNGSRDISIENATVYHDTWDNAPTSLPAVTNTSADVTVAPAK